MLELMPVTGDHTYVVAPEAVIVVDVPRHTAAEPGVAVTVGTALTVIVWVALLLQPLVVPVTE